MTKALIVLGAANFTIICILLHQIIKRRKK